MTQQTFDVPAEYVVVPVERIHKGPPPPYNNWSVDAILHFLRGLGIQVDQFKTWCRDKDTGGYRLYYKGEAPTEKALAKLLH